jgi:hypothetical protein
MMHTNRNRQSGLITIGPFLYSNDNAQDAETEESDFEEYSDEEADRVVEAGSQVEDESNHEVGTEEEPDYDMGRKKNRP